MTLHWDDLLKIAHGIDIEAAASEAKKNALQKKYGLGTQDVELAAETDPTPNGEYTEWICREMKHDRLMRWTHDIQTPDEVVVRVLKDFTRLKQSPAFIEAVKAKQYTADIMRMEWNDLYRVVRETKQLISRNQQEENTLTAFKLWSGTYTGNANTAKIDVYMFDPEDLGSGGAEAYALASSGPSLDPQFNPLPQTSWCTVDAETAETYLEDGPAYIIKVNGKNFCNIHEDSHQCRDAKNQSFANVSTVGNPIVQFACKGAKIELKYFILGDHTCYLCHKPYVSPVADTREGREGKIMCFTCFHKDWVSEIKRYINQLYNAIPDSFTEEPTTRNMQDWVMQLWDIDGDEHERNFWILSDVDHVLRDIGVIVSKNPDTTK